MSVLEMKEGNIARLTITVEKDAFVKALNDAYHKTAGRYPVPGFRKGKAPRKVIETNYGAMVFYDEAFDLCWAEPYDAAIREHDLTPVDRPSVVDIPKMSEAEGVTYVAEVQLKPEVTLGQYKGIAVKKLAYTVTDEEVDEALKMEQQKQVRYEDVDRPVENGDRIILDYCGKVDGVAFEGGTAEDQTLDIGSGTFIPGFEEQLIGVNPGEEKDIHVTFPEEYHAENLKGKPAVFTCKVKAVQKKELPEIDDEFIKDISEQDTVAEWKEAKRKELLEAREKAAKNARENELLEKAADNATVDIPDCMVDREVQYMMQSFGYQLAASGLKMDDYFKYMGTDREKMEAMYRPDAKQRVKTELVIEAIRKAENVIASDAEIDEAIEKYAQQNGMPLDQLKENLRDDDKAYFADQVSANKIIDLLVETAVETDEEPEAPKAE
ncbi:MAG: trigger factor [Clostridia bacterium]|nr:trigger factor [Clostridia bacterium]